MKVNRSTNRIIHAISTGFTTGYTFRTAGALARKSGATESAVLSVAKELGCDVNKKRRRDRACLVGKPSKFDLNILAAVSTSLLDERYSLRSTKAVQEALSRSSLGSILDHAASVGYDTSRTRRSDHVRMIGLSA